MQRRTFPRPANTQRASCRRHNDEKGKKENSLTSSLPAPRRSSSVHPHTTASREGEGSHHCSDIIIIVARNLAGDGQPGSTVPHAKASPRQPLTAVPSSTISYDDDDGPPAPAAERACAGEERAQCRLFIHRLHAPRSIPFVPSRPGHRTANATPPPPPLTPPPSLLLPVRSPPLAWPHPPSSPPSTPTPPPPPSGGGIPSPPPPPSPLPVMASRAGRLWRREMAAACGGAQDGTGQRGRPAGPPDKSA